MPALLQGLLGILQQIQQDLQKLCKIAFDSRQTLRVRNLQFNGPKDVPVWNVAAPFSTFPGSLAYGVPLRNRRSTPSLCEPIASTPGWVSTSPVKRPRSAS